MSPEKDETIPISLIQSSDSERRKSFRVSIHWELSFTMGGAVFSTRTSNLSSGGFYFLSAALLVPGTVISCLLKVPTHRSQAVLWLSCTARVVRVQPANDRSLYGAGCEIEDYWFPHIRAKSRLDSRSSISTECSGETGASH
jgi:hypothetical protein